jgi:uncharacterized cofD-like protein
LGAGVREALADFDGPVVYVANMMTQPGETIGFTLADHLQAIGDHVGDVVTDVLVHAGVLPSHLIARYRAEGAAPVGVDDDAIRALGVRLHRAPLLPEEIGDEVRHDAARLARAVCEVAALRVPATRPG